MRHFITVSVFVGLIIIAYAGDQSYRNTKRIDCYPDRESPFLDYSKEICLARNCLFDDEALPNEIQCYTVVLNLDNKELYPVIQHQISMIKTQGSALSVNKNDTMKKQNLDIMTVEPPDIVKNNPKYRIACSPDIDEYRSFCVLNLSENRTLNTTNQSCTARGCAWDSNAGPGIATCYIPIEQGGYGVTGGSNQLSNATTQYSLTRLSTKLSYIRSMPSIKSIDLTNEFSMFNHDVNNLNVQVSISGTDMIRMTIRDVNTQRYEVPVPIQWNSSASSSFPVRIKFQMTKTANGQVGFRVQRTNKQSILFDTSLFANGFVYDDKFIQIITTIPSRNVYGKLRSRYFN